MVVGSPFGCAMSVNKLTVCDVPALSTQVKFPACACCVGKYVPSVVNAPGCLDMAKVPKKNNLSLRIGPPRLPPKSFRWNEAFFRPEALFTQLFALSAELR